MKTTIEALWLYLLLLISSRSSFSSKSCDLRLNSSPQWFHINGAPHYYDEEMNVCPLSRSTSSTSPLSSSKKVYMLDFGDSFEWGACREHGSSEKEHKEEFIGSLSASVKLCSIHDDPLQIIASRIYGIDGDRLFSNITSLQSIVETSRVLSAHGIDTNTDLDIVTYGSFVWDLKHRHEKFCVSLRRKANISEALAANTMLSLACGSFLMRLDKNLTMSSSLSEKHVQMWSNYELPWCGTIDLEKWKKGYLVILSSILENYPKSKIALRTQVIGGHVLFGNKHCYTPMNNFVRYVASLKIFQFLKLLDLFNVKNKLEASEMKSIAPDILFALIDQEALAVSKIEDEGKTPRYSEDFIHLYDHGGYKHYRMYMEKVAFQLYTS